MRSCWRKGCRDGTRDGEEAPERGGGCLGWRQEAEGVSGQFGWMGRGPSKMENGLGQARTLMLWLQGLCPMISALLPASSNPNTPQGTSSFSQPEMPCPCPSPLALSHLFPCIHPSHPSSRSPPSARSGKLSYPDVHPPSSWVPKKIVSWKIGFFSTPSPRLPKAQSRHTYQQLACFKVPSPQCFVVGCCDNSGNKTTSIGSS